MKLENQVCSLEQAKRLRELGVIQGTSTFAFIKNRCRDEDEYYLRIVDGHGVSYAGYETHGTGCLEGYSAFTVSEIMLMLPVSINSDPVTIQKDEYACCEDCDIETVYITGYKGITHFSIGCGQYTIAGSAAGCLIILLNNGYLTAEQANERLQNA